MDKITEIVVDYIKNLERIEADLTDDVEDLAERCRNLDLDNKLLIEALERIARFAQNPARIAEDALDAMTCKGRG